MRTWWIVRTTVRIHIWQYHYKPLLHKCTLGPFWTYEEAKELLEKWV